MIKLNGRYYVTPQEFVECIGECIPDTTFVDFTELDSLNTELAKISPIFKVKNGDNYFDLDDLGLDGKLKMSKIEKRYGVVVNSITAFSILTVSVNADIDYSIPVFVKSSIIENRPVELNVVDMFITEEDVLEYFCVDLEGFMSENVFQEFESMKKYLAGNYFSGHSTHTPILGVKNFAQVVLQQLMDADCFKNLSDRKLDFDGDIIEVKADEAVLNRIIKLRDAFNKFTQEFSFQRHEN